jgi:hypothetical protein
MLVFAGIATEAHLGGARRAAAPVSWVVFFSALVLVIFAVRGVRGPAALSADEIRSIVSATAVATMTVISLRVVLTDGRTPPRRPAQTWMLAALVSAGRTGCSSPCPRGLAGRAAQRRR